MKTCSIKRGFKVRARVAMLTVLTLATALAVLWSGFPLTKTWAQTGQALLEVRVTKSIEWVNGCLNVSIDRTNHSTSTIFLPNRGIYLDASVMYSRSELEESQEPDWLNLYGVFDIVDNDATPLQPGATRHDEICYIRPTVIVSDFKKKTSRKIPVRGRLRVDAYYFQTEQDWLKNRKQLEELHTPYLLGGTQENHPHVVRAETAIPCYENGCKPGCDKPPVIVGDERSFLFNFSEAEWFARGESITKSLEQKHLPCGEPKEVK